MMTRPFPRLTLLLASFVFCQVVWYSGQNLSAWAVQVLPNRKSPLHLKSNTFLDGSVSHPGDPFEAVLNEDVQLEGTTIPKDTRFSGHVEDARTSKRFGRNGSLQLMVDKVRFPSGEEIQFYLGELPQGHEAYSKDNLDTYQVNRKKRWFQLPVAAASFVVPFPVTLALYGAAGAAIGLQDKNNQQDSPLKRMGKGIYNESVTPVVRFFKKQPTPRFRPGDDIYLYLPEEALVKIFRLTPTF